MLILGIVNLAVPASALARAGDDETSRSEVTRKTPLLAPGVLQRSITDAAHRAAQQAPQPQSGTAADSHSQKACWIGAALLGGAGAAFVTAWAKHRSWADSGATTTPGAKPPSSVGVSVAIGAVLVGAGIFVTSKTCGK
jgi:hypothetical protein